MIRLIRRERAYYGGRGENVHVFVRSSYNLVNGTNSLVVKSVSYLEKTIIATAKTSAMRR
jgi:hypothetical protein